MGFEVGRRVGRSWGGEGKVVARKPKRVGSESAWLSRGGGVSSD
jgi:hypothetical protein